ncbi:MAG TPA: HIT family protein [Methylomirabilota bacterium]|jgi:diadenosine tetraphosphate (Ap4A) HIT family hydrolase|nr:HIT family protein [Methylomirabilota bacterium]
MTVTACVMCERVSGEGDLFIADLGASRAYLNEDQFFPGWVFVVLRRHATELYELSAAERGVLIEDVNRAAEALHRVYNPVKMNYELLGNQVPHIHWHLIPRLAGDPDPHWPVWRVTHEPRPLAPAEREAQIRSIRQGLGLRQ